MHGTTWLRSLLAAALIAVPALAAGACGDDNEEGVDGGEAGVPAIEISGPEDGDTIEPGDIKVSADVGGFEVVDKLGENPVAGEGHVHFYIDADEIPTAPGRPAVTADKNTYHAEATTSFTWLGVRPGRHTFGVQLVNNNHTPLEPPVTDEVSVTVE